MLDTVREFKYTKLSPEEQKSRGILGRLAGIIADFKHPTRNERFYSESLWDKTFDQPLMKEKLENKLLLGELGHPENRSEIDMEKVAICLAEKPVKCDDGKIRGVFDILDTPNGRILKTLCDYGCKIGVSSRGNGDVFEDFEHGGDKVDEDTYEMECWDAVLIPAVKEARPQYINESLNSKTLKKALNEALDQSSKDDRRVMENTLKELNININPEKEEDIKVEEKEVEETKDTANNDGVEMVEQLQESLKKQETLEAKVIELQEQLSARYAREAKYEEELTKYKTVVVNLSESAKEAKEFKSKVISLQEELDKLKNVKLQNSLNIKSLNEDFNSINSKYDALNSKYESLKENYRVKGQRIIELEKSLNEANKIADNKEKILKENLEEVKQNSVIKTKEYSQKLEKANKIVEYYKNVAQKAVDRYITEKARMLGISNTEIKNKLNESYSFTDIDRICEDLKQYNLSVSKLPFQLEKVQKVKVTESKNDPLKIPNGFDDTVDDDLIRLAEGINN